jgi:hypothetical protein
MRVDGISDRGLRERMAGNIRTPHQAMKSEREEK